MARAYVVSGVGNEVYKSVGNGVGNISVDKYIVLTIDKNILTKVMWGTLINMYTRST